MNFQSPASDSPRWAVFTNWWRSMGRRALSWARMWRRSPCRAIRMPIVSTAPMDMLWSICCKRIRSIRLPWARRCCVVIRSRNRSVPMSYPRTSNRSTRCTGRRARYASTCPRWSRCAKRCKYHWKHCATITSARSIQRPIRWVHIIKYLYMPYITRSPSVLILLSRWLSAIIYIISYTICGCRMRPLASSHDLYKEPSLAAERNNKPQ